MGIQQPLHHQSVAGSLLTHVGSSGDMVVQQVAGSHAVSVLVQQPVYQVSNKVTAGSINRPQAVDAAGCYLASAGVWQQIVTTWSGAPCNSNGSCGTAAYMVVAFVFRAAVNDGFPYACGILPICGSCCRSSQWFAASHRLPLQQVCDCGVQY